MNIDIDIHNRELKSGPIMITLDLSVLNWRKLFENQVFTSFRHAVT